MFLYQFVLKKQAQNKSNSYLNKKLTKGDFVVVVGASSVVVVGKMVLLLLLKA